MAASVLLHFGPPACALRSRIRRFPRAHRRLFHGLGTCASDETCGNGYHDVAIRDGCETDCTPSCEPRAPLADGSPCGDGNLCRSGAYAAPGCDNDCSFSCAVREDGDDGLVCNGEETCDTAAHVCLAAADEADGSPCDADPATRDICLGGACGRSICGDSFVDTEGMETCNAPAGLYFATTPASLPLDAGGNALCAHRSGGAEYDPSAPPDRLTGGIISGFLTEADAALAVVPAAVPFVGGTSMWSNFAAGGGSGSSPCPEMVHMMAVDDRDTLGGTSGFVVHFHFEADRVDWAP